MSQSSVGTRGIFVERLAVGIVIISLSYHDAKWECDRKQQLIKASQCLPCLSSLSRQTWTRLFGKAGECSAATT